jgi:hypothetical protein
MSVEPMMMRARKLIPTQGPCRPPGGGREGERTRGDVGGGRSPPRRGGGRGGAAAPSPGGCGWAEPPRRAGGGGSRDGQGPSIGIDFYWLSLESLRRPFASPTPPKAHPIVPVRPSTPLPQALQSRLESALRPGPSLSARRMAPHRAAQRRSSRGLGGQLGGGPSVRPLSIARPRSFSDRGVCSLSDRMPIARLDRTSLLEDYARPHKRYACARQASESKGNCLSTVLISNSPESSAGAYCSSTCVMRSTSLSDEGRWIRRVSLKAAEPNASLSRCGRPGGPRPARPCARPPSARA